MYSHKVQIREQPLHHLVRCRRQIRVSFISLNLRHRHGKDIFIINIYISFLYKKELENQGVHAFIC